MVFASAVDDLAFLVTYRLGDEVGNTRYKAQEAQGRVYILLLYDSLMEFHALLPQQ